MSEVKSTATKAELITGPFAGSPILSEVGASLSLYFFMSASEYYIVAPKITVLGRLRVSAYQRSMFQFLPGYSGAPKSGRVGGTRYS